MSISTSLLARYFLVICGAKIRSENKLLCPQFHHIFVPPSADPHGHWNRCKLNPAACSPEQMDTLQGWSVGTCVFSEDNDFINIYLPFI